jgi:hypothetical protein
MKTIAYRDETTRRGSILGDRPVFTRQKSSIDEEGKGNRGVKFRREETQMLDALLEDVPRLVSPRVDGSESAATTPRSRELHKQLSKQYEAATLDELDRISKDIERMEAEKSALIQELQITLENERSVEAVENARLQLEHSDLMADKDGLDKEFHELSTKMDTLNAFNEKQKFESDHMLKRLVDDGDELRLDLLQATQIIEQRERRAKRESEGIKLPEGEESETLSDFSASSEDLSSDDSSDDESIENQKSRSRSSSEDEAKQKAAGNVSPAKAVAVDPPSPGSVATETSRSHSKSSSSSSDRTPRKAKPASDEKEKVSNSPPPNAILLPASQASNQSNGNTAKVQTITETPTPATEKPKKEKSAGCFSCFGGKKKK